jgi:primosomal protein N'
MQISVGNITAQCKRCGGEDFESRSAGTLRLATELKCAQCGVKARYLALLDQIGEEAMRRANKAIDELKKPQRQ